MKTFKYDARSLEGTTVNGVVEANTQDEAISQLRDDGLIVISIEKSGGIIDIDLKISNKRVKAKTLSITCKQFSIILKAGIPIIRAIELIANQTEDKTLKKILSLVRDDVSAGYPLADSFAKHGSSLPQTFIETVRAGESSGNLDVCFDRLSNYFDRTSKARSKVINAMIYPIFVVGVAVVVVGVLMAFAIPTFKSTFESLGQDMPPLTQFMIACSDFWVDYWMLVFGAIVLCVVIWKVLRRRSEAINLWASQLGMKIPVLGAINVMNATAQYAGTMAVMMQAGLSMTRAVEITSRSITNYYMAHALASTQAELEAGKQLSDSLKRTEAYPDLVVEMTGVGERTGSLESTLEVMSDYYDNEVANATTRALSILEPVTIVFLGGIVCVILLAVYLPMFTLETSSV